MQAPFHPRGSQAPRCPSSSASYDPAGALNICVARPPLGAPPATGPPGSPPSPPSLAEVPRATPLAPLCTDLSSTSSTAGCLAAATLATALWARCGRKAALLHAHLHKGQLADRRSHSMRHARWCSWPHGRLLSVSPAQNAPRQIGHGDSASAKACAAAALHSCPRSALSCSTVAPAHVHRAVLLQRCIKSAPCTRIVPKTAAARSITHAMSAKTTSRRSAPASWPPDIKQMQ